LASIIQFIELFLDNSWLDRSGALLCDFQGLDCADGEGRLDFSIVDCRLRLRVQIGLDKSIELLFLIELVVRKV